MRKVCPGLPAKAAVGILRALCMAGCLAMCGCGGGGGGGGGGPVTLVSISVDAPQNPLNVEASEQLSAHAHYSDGSSSDITTSATWSTSDPAVIQLGAATAIGTVITGLEAGTADVIATFKGTDGSTRIMVGPPITSISLASIQNLPYSVAVGGSTSYAVWAYFQGNAFHEATSSSRWTTSDPTIASLSTIDGHVYVAGLKPGTATLTVSVYGLSKEVPFTVMPISTLQYGAASAGFQYGQVAMDAAGNAMAAWVDPGEGPQFNVPAYAYISAYSPATGWGPINTPGSLLTGNQPNNATISSNANGVYARAWRTLDGLYATRYTPTTGWQAPQLIYSFSINTSAGGTIRTAVDPLGNIVLVWVEGTLWSATLLYNQDAWSAPSQVPNSTRYASNGPVTLVMNSAGQAAALWESWYTSWARNVALFSFSAGWTSSTLQDTSACYANPVLAINGSGAMLEAGVNICPSSGSPTVFANRYDPGTGWQPTDVITTNAFLQPNSVGVALNDDGNGALIWTSAWDSSVHAVNYAPAGGWSSDNLLSTGNAGTAQVYPPQMTADGRVLALWVTGQQYAGSSIYKPGAGWGPETQLSHIGFKHEISGISFASNAAGKVVAVWSEYYTEEWSLALLEDIYADNTISF